MSNPNKTVGKWRMKHGYAPKPPKPYSDFMLWLFEQAKAGATFKDEAEAREAFAKTKEQDK